MGGGHSKGCKWPPGTPGAGAQTHPASADSNSGWKTSGVHTALDDVVGGGGNLFGTVAGGAMNILGERGRRTEEEYLTILNKVTANVAIQALQECQNTIDTSQTLDLNCGDFPISGEDYNQTPTCLLMVDLVSSRLDGNYAKLVEEAQGYDANVHVPGGIGNLAQQKQMAIDALHAAGARDPTSFVCQACSSFNVSQKQVLSISSNCSFTDTIQNTINSQMGAAVSQELKNKESFIGEIGGVLSGGNRDCMSADLANKMTSNMNANVVTKLITNIRSAQSLSIADNSRSVFVDSVKQSINLKSLATLTSRLGIQNGLYNTDDVKAGQNLYYSNDAIDDLASSLGETITGMAEIVNSTVGKMLFVVIGLGAVAIIMFAVIMQTHKGMRSRVANTVGVGGSATFTISVRQTRK